ncbi:hypothetical protein GYMLUDRAFT_236962 [Collybiopsis luxurians FD-317 M1]|nr:hypothetical protein GYMLUDRAFT_236962 [Collybiopsis luxurians FD-317 M1]
MARVESWLKDGVTVSFMRHITVKDTLDYWQVCRRDEPDEAQDTNKWASLVQLLIRNPYLASFTFDCHEQIPIVILDALHSHHSTTYLHIRNWTRIAKDSVFGDPAEEALANSSCLRSLHGHFVTDRGRKADYRLTAFDRIVKLSPNLESISKTTAHNPRVLKCIGSGYSSEETEIQNAERLKFKVGEPRRKAIKSLEMKSSDAATLKKLSTYIDLSQLTTLKNIQLASDFLFLAAEDPTFRLSSLTNLDVRLHAHWNRDRQNELTKAFEVFLASLSPLQSLTVKLATSRPWSSILSSILLHHSTSLKTLSLHQVESVEKPMRDCLTVEELDDICSSCKKLTSLGLDIDRRSNMEQERAYYAILRQSINLRALTIHTDPDLAYHTKPLFTTSNQKLPKSDPGFIPQHQGTECNGEADEAFALKVWEEVSQKGSAREGIQLLVVCLGEQSWPRGRRVTVQRNERNDRLDEVDVAIHGRSR